MAIILFSVAWGLFHKSSCVQAGLLLGVLFQHGGDDDELRGVRHAGLPPLLLLHRQIPHHGHHHPWGGPSSGTNSLEKFWTQSNSVDQVATLVSITLAIFGLDASNFKVLILEIIISFQFFHLFILIHDDLKLIIPTWRRTGWSASCRAQVSSQASSGLLFTENFYIWEKNDSCC